MKETSKPFESKRWQYVNMLVVIAFLAIAALTGAVTKGWDNDTLYVPNFTRYVDIPPGYASLGPTGPDEVTVGTVFRALSFDATGETVFFNWEVPDDWVLGTSVYLRTYFTNFAGDAIAAGETVIFDISYRIKAGGAVYDAGSVSTGTVTYTQAGAGTDKETHNNEIELVHNDADNPIVKDYIVGVVFNRDTALAGGGNDTYSGDLIILRWEIKYTANTVKLH